MCVCVCVCVRGVVWSLDHLTKLLAEADNQWNKGIGPSANCTRITIDEPSA